MPGLVPATRDVTTSSMPAPLESRALLGSTRKGRVTGEAVNRRGGPRPVDGRGNWDEGFRTRVRVCLKIRGRRGRPNLPRPGPPGRGRAHSAPVFGKFRPPREDGWRSQFETELPGAASEPAAGRRCGSFPERPHMLRPTPAVSRACQTRSHVSEQARAFLFVSKRVRTCPMRLCIPGPGLVFPRGSKAAFKLVKEPLEGQKPHRFSRRSPDNPDRRRSRITGLLATRWAHSCYKMAAPTLQTLLRKGIRRSRAADKSTSSLSPPRRSNVPPLGGQAGPLVRGRLCRRKRKQKYADQVPWIGFGYHCSCRASLRHPICDNPFARCPEFGADVPSMRKGSSPLRRTGVPPNQPRPSFLRSCEHLCRETWISQCVRGLCESRAWLADGQACDSGPQLPASKVGPTTGNVTSNVAGPSGTKAVRVTKPAPRRTQCPTSGLNSSSPYLSVNTQTLPSQSGDAWGLGSTSPVHSIRLALPATRRGETRLVS